MTQSHDIPFELSNGSEIHRCRHKKTIFVRVLSIVLAVEVVVLVAVARAYYSAYYVKPLTTEKKKIDYTCPVTVKSSRHGIEANLTDREFYEKYFWFEGLNSALFWHEVPGRPSELLDRLYAAWGYTCYDNRNAYTYNLVEHGYEQRHWINQSYVVASAARYFNLTVFLLAINITMEDLERYIKYEPLSTQNLDPPIIDIFCSVERVVLYDRDIWVIGNQATAEYCIRTSPQECQKKIERESILPGFIGIDQLCGHIDVDKIVHHPLHPKYWCAHHAHP